MKKFFESKAFKICRSVVNIAVVVLVIAFVLIVCLQRFSNNCISFFNYRMFTVISGSMEPKYKVGDVLVAKEVAPEKVKVGDTISYLGKVGQFNDKVITHEVVEITKDENGKLLFHTKGLANLVEDPIVGQDQLYGVVVYRSFIMSSIYKIVGTTVGMFIFIIIPIFYILGSEIITAMLEKEEERRSKSKK
ncbi:MAG: signal peptidase I [Bacilli bacterium]|nr:signal peptidase I [Bacilli bacterium]